MKRKVINLFTATMAVIALQIGALKAQPVITVNEYGTGFFGPPGGPAGLMGSAIGPDPFGAVGLFYILPFAGTPGDIVLTEGPNTQPSDLLRFDGQGRLFFWSDALPTDPPDAPADVFALPPPVGIPLVFVEAGLEGGVNGLFGYVPGPGMSGFDPSLPTYNFISDTPEPTASLLAGLGAGLIVLCRRGRMFRR